MPTKAWPAGTPLTRSHLRRWALRGTPSPPSASLTQVRAHGLLCAPLTCCPRFLLTQRPVRFRSPAELCGRDGLECAEEQHEAAGCGHTTVFAHSRGSDAAGVAGEDVTVTSVTSPPASDVHASGETAHTRMWGGGYRETASREGTGIRSVQHLLVGFYVSARPVQKCT